eukprot:Anaeramoba_flamelloidesc36411_g1_i2.p1 GENE.c36411_g1_i2~~c36411_g1_i2.p1  ORF type:complete len:118 (-),score=9.94 c36411_g1_i2:25-378(-)
MDFFLFFLVSGLIAFTLFMIWSGANDAANSMGTAYGSKVFTLRRALTYGAICEMLGSISIGNFVSETIRSGIVKPSSYENEPLVFMYGMFAALFGAMLWLVIASYFGYVNISDFLFL